MGHLGQAVRHLGLALRSALSWGHYWGQGGWGGHYPSTDPTRKILEQAFLRTRPATADEALVPSLETLLAQARFLDRAAPVARGAVNGFCADLIGSGIGIEPMTGDESIDEILSDGFEAWAKHAGVCGESLWELQRIAGYELPTAGASLWRWIALPELASEGQIPWRLLDLEVEWFATQPVQPVPQGQRFVRGKLLDHLGRTVAYDLVNPEDPISGEGERVPADRIIHAYERRRARQRHGEPRLASAIERLKQDDDIISCELKAAKNGSGIALVVTRTGTNGLPVTTEITYDANGNQKSERNLDIPVGAVTQLQPGEDIKSFQLNRPNPDIQAFRGGTKGDIAASQGVSRQWLDRDTSAAKYSSMRSDRMQTQKLIGPLQPIIGRYLASDVYTFLVPHILLAAGRLWPADPAAQRRLLHHELRPDGLEYDDPVKDGDADYNGVARNMTTLDEVTARKGRNWRRVVRQRQKENEYLAKHDLPIPSLQQFSLSIPGATDVEGVAEEGEVQGTALNGAQVTALQEILAAVAAGTLPQEAAVGIIMLAFPLFNQEQVEAMVSSAAKDGKSAEEVADNDA